MLSLKEIFLDVSDLLPPEPLEKILNSLDCLNEGEYLRVFHRKDACLLYPFLTERGFSSNTRGAEGSGFHIYIWRNNDLVAEEISRIIKKEDT